MSKRNLYVAAGHEAIWMRAEALAAERGVSLSTYVALALHAVANRVIDDLAVQYQLTSPVMQAQLMEEMGFPVLQEQVDRLQRRIEILESFTGFRSLKEAEAESCSGS